MPPWIARCALLCLGLLPLGCKEARRQLPPPPVAATRPSLSLTPAEALLLPEARWIDVRTRAERSQGYLPGSLLLPLDELPQRIGELDAARQQPLILVCASGARAQQAATLLRTAGFPRVHVLQGGMLSWNGPLQAPRLDADGDGFQDRFPAGLSLLVVRQPDPEHPLPGLEVHTVYPGGPAHRKLHIGEVITAIDDRPLDAAALAAPSYKNLFPATSAALRVRSRDGTEREVRLPPTSAEPPPPPPKDPPTPRWPSPVLEALRSPEGTAFREVSRRQTRAWLPSALPLPASLLLDPARFGALLRGFPLPSLLEPAPVDRTVRQTFQELHTLLGSTGEPAAPRGSPLTPEAIAAMVREAQQLASRALEGLTPAEQQRLAGLAGRRRGALERRAFLHDAADAAERDELIELAELGRRFHTGRCVGALEHLSRAVDPGFLRGVKAAWRGARPREAPEGFGVEGSVVGWLSTPQGPVVLGGPGPNRYRGAFLAIVDVGGDDRYELQAGQEPPLLLDLEGNDRYEVEDREGPWPVGRATLLADLQGDDFYGSSLSGLGYGYFGAAALVEAGGDDRYEVERSGLGAGRFGAGVLLDMGGDDRYQGGRGSQGFGGPGGVGMLVEVGG
ncbi:MAG: rhodanese-like domain-containing protein, partial [Polyangiaceae bacterium]|nr:rhodanese-like domain-containing protein [Polyangiaceae bacterium]